MRAAIVGTGNIALRHYNNLRSLVPECEIAVLTRNKDLANKQKKFKSSKLFFFNSSQLIDFQPQLAIICSPASFHIELAIELSEYPIHLFIEKPISHSIEGIDQLIKIRNNSNSLCMIGYPLRFNESMIHLRNAINEKLVGQIEEVHSKCFSYLPDWRPNIDYRNSVSAKKSLGGGVLLELSHEIDYLRWIFGEPKIIKAENRKNSNLEIDVEDYALVEMEFKNDINKNINAELSLNFASNDLLRECLVVGKKGLLKWDGINNEVTLKNISQIKWQKIYTSNGKETDQMYINELKYFLHCIKKQDAPKPDILDAYKTLEIVLEAKLGRDKI